MNKTDISYAVKGSKMDYKEIDEVKRTVDLVANTYLFFDSDRDVLIPGCSAKSISERGPQSNKPGKIKHLKGHDINEMIAIPTLISEEKFKGNEVLRCNSYFPESEDSENELINYKSGMYDQHSIGFRYLQVEVAQAFTQDQKSKKLWDEWIGKIINPKDAEAVGYMFIVKEIALFEYSTVAFGANRLTPYLGAKSENKVVRFDNLMKKLDALLRSDIDKDIKDLQERQFKQMLYELLTEEPQRKPLNNEPERPVIHKVDELIKSVQFKLN